MSTLTCRIGVIELPQIKFLESLLSNMYVFNVFMIFNVMVKFGRKVDMMDKVRQW